MKLKQHQFSIQPRIFEGSTYSHPWYQHVAKENGCIRKSDKAISWYDYNKTALVEYYGDQYLQLNRPNPPSKESIKRAKFIDKTYEWKGRTNSIRSRD